MDNNQNFNGAPMNNQYNQNMPVKKTNGFAIAGFVLSILCGFPLGTIFSIVGIAKAKECNSGKGLAIAGLIISLIYVILIIVIAAAGTVFTSLIWGEIKNDIVESTYCSQAYSCGTPNSSGYATCKYKDEYNEEQTISCLVNNDGARTTTRTTTTTRAISSNPLVGYYDCKGATSSEYSMSLEFKENNVFRYGAYDDLDDNHYSGTYSYVHETSKDGKVQGATYYMLTLTYDKDDYIKEGIKQDWPAERGNVGEAEIGLATVSGKKQGALIFTNTYNTYLCYER